ncbi:hypothetical protein EF384_09570 [Aerococcus agrisoli]|uniref:Uncharacterized protein n=1 Tax=Aerococcus agrisoli TaxID=2487350 RepID=A0A3N4FYM6_9LACT|nr:hypothetical protein [Aerococcus agrisoli]RPA55198.1 hypothetical protein EF384_09570 [Aerococcus agrisoli]
MKTNDEKKRTCITCGRTIAVPRKIMICGNCRNKAKKYTVKAVGAVGAVGMAKNILKKIR